MKRVICSLLVLLLMSSLVGCSTDTYTIDSESKKFIPKTVTTITLAGPNNIDSSGTTVVLDPTNNSTDFNRLIDLIQGEKLEECPTDSFIPGKITFTFESGKTTTVYPATDGSNYIALYSVNPSIAQYLELSEEDMNEVISILEKNGVFLNY